MDGATIASYGLMQQPSSKTLPRTLPTTSDTPATLQTVRQGRRGNDIELDKKVEQLCQSKLNTIIAGHVAAGDQQKQHVTAACAETASWQHNT